MDLCLYTAVTPSPTGSAVLHIMPADACCVWRTNTNRRNRRIRLKGAGVRCIAGANKRRVSVGQRRDNFVLGSLITSSEALNESSSAITHGGGGRDTVEEYPWRRHSGRNQVKETYRG